MAAAPSGGASAASVMNLLTDMAFNLLIFFVVCASTEPDRGRPQQMPSASKEKANEQKAQNIEVEITRTAVTVNKSDVPPAQLRAKFRELLAGKNRPDDRVVVVKVADDAPYRQWIQVTGEIEQAGGVITLQLEEEREVGVR